MTIYTIYQPASGATVWQGPADSEPDALEHWAMDAGYDSHADMVERVLLGADTIEVVEVMPASIIKTARENARLSQVDLAQALGVDVMTVSNWERGVYAPNAKAIAALDRELGIGGELLEAIGS